jgi:peptidyl-prolyl cis-trans isomerase B (cyclophilin B)
MRLSLSYHLLTRCILLAFAGSITVAAAQRTAQPSREILKLESARSLGQGRLASLLESRDEIIAARAALAIGRTRRAAGIPLLQRHLDDPRDAVRALSVYGLGVMGLGSDVADVVKLAGGDPSGAVRIGAIDALGRYEAGKRLDAAQEATAAGTLLAVMRSNPDAMIRGRAALSLWTFWEGPQAAYVSAQIARAMPLEHSNYVRERMMWTIFRGYATLVPRSLLVMGLHDSDEIVRIESVRAFGKLKDRSAVATLEPLLEDPSWRVQEQTAESIRQLEGKPLTAHLTAIPKYVHLPARVPDALAALPAMPRKNDGGKQAAPNAGDAIVDPTIDPRTAAAMLSPAHGLHPRLRIVTTKGNVYVVLYPEWAPLTVANFLNLTNRGFYDRNPWFRIVPDFVVQTGERDAKKAPGPGYTIGAEENPLEQNSYVISMGLDYNDKTNTPIRDSAGSEYYVTLSPQYHLDNAFTVFGAVTSGFDVLARLDESDSVIRIERIPDANL